MCGLAGFAGGGTQDDLVRMSAAVAHRGPDGAGEYVDGPARVFLAHRRLAILDLEGGAQPMWDASGETGVVFNGEIYNHRELRAELEALGHRFQSDHSDTEVLVHGYRAWGAALPQRLNGMFAFVVFDRRARRLFAARDRFGKKPFYYCAHPDGLVFGSELAAVLAHGAVRRDLDEVALQKYFGYGYLPAPWTLYRGVKKLPGGHHLTLDLASARLATDAYWRFAIEVQEPRASEDELAEELRRLLAQAVRRRLISDVPLGVFLSGGLDSSAVLAYAAQAAGSERVRTFAIGFDEPSFDESRHARAAASAFGAQHGERVLRLESAREAIPALLGALDEPTGDSSVLPTHILSRFTRESVTVALGGDGGDELFAGYDPFSAIGPAMQYARWMPRPLHRAAKALAGALPVSHGYMSAGFRAQRSLRGLDWPPALWNPVWLAPVGPDDAKRLFERPLAPEELYSEAVEAWAQSGAAHPVDRALEFYARFYLQDDILAKVDRASMLVALEVRAPFLDNDLVDFARRLPHRYKVRHGRRKVLLRSALRGVLPDEILARRKQGFAVPIGRWLRDWPEADETLDAPGLRSGAMKAFWREHRAGRADHRQLLWCGLALRPHL
jgi:asparagine synthase (glutamine-hydrolysing)